MEVAITVFIPFLPPRFLMAWANVHGVEKPMSSMIWEYVIDAIISVLNGGVNLNDENDELISRRSSIPTETKGDCNVR